MGPSLCSLQRIQLSLRRCMVRNLFVALFKIRTNFYRESVNCASSVRSEIYVAYSVTKIIRKLIRKFAWLQLWNTCWRKVIFHLTKKSVKFEPGFQLRITWLTTHYINNLRKSIYWTVEHKIFVTHLIRLEQNSKRFEWTSDIRGFHIDEISLPD